MSHTRDVLDHVDDERRRQDDRWGQQNHDDGTWALILGEEVGEVSQAALDLRKNASHGEEQSDRLTLLLRAELVQVAAVTVSWIEAIDRRWE